MKTQLRLPNRFSLSRLARASSTAVLALGLASGAYAQDRLQAVEIAAAVERELLADPSVDFHAVNVRVTDGIVTLSGEAPSLLAKRRAVEHALKVKGVESVVDIASVASSSKTDKQIEADAKTALKLDPAADAYELTLVVKGGTVTLRGEVQSFAERRLAEDVVAGVEGVRKIENQAIIRYTADRSDAEVAADVRARLDRDARVDSGLIVVDVDQGKVELSGAVGSAWERERASIDAWVAGTKSVSADGLKVEWWARDKMQKTGDVRKSDEEIKKAVRAAFLHDPRVYSFNPVIGVRSGVVTLMGVVEDRKASLAAEEDARNTVGVWRVQNYLKVRPAAFTSDEQLRDDVRQALLRDPFVDRYQIAVTADEGTVALTGTVDSAFERLRAEEVAAGIRGVVDIRNNLAVQRNLAVYWTGADSDLEIAQEVRDQLFWSPFVDSDEVKVAVQDGVATLTGTVDSYAERALAEENAFEGGALRVRNRLKVNGGADLSF